MAHPRFHAGRLTTGFIAEEFPDGFHGVDLPDEAKGDVVAVAAVVHQTYARRAVSSTPRFKTAAPVANGKWVVKSGKEQHEVTVVETAMGHAVIAGRRSRELVSDWQIGDPIYRGRIDNRPHHRADRSRRHRLSDRAWRRAAEGPGAGAARGRRSPAICWKRRRRTCPSTCCRRCRDCWSQISVKEGQDIKAGQELAVVEAMKMENMLRAERDGKVAKLHAKAGDSLSVDQVIVEFA